MEKNTFSLSNYEPDCTVKELRKSAAEMIVLA